MFERSIPLQVDVHRRNLETEVREIVRDLGGLADFVWKDHLDAFHAGHLARPLQLVGNGHRVLVLAEAIPQQAEEGGEHSVTHRKVLARRGRWVRSYERLAPAGRSDPAKSSLSSSRMIGMNLVPFEVLADERPIDPIEPAPDSVGHPHVERERLDRVLSHG